MGGGGLACLSERGLGRDYHIRQAASNGETASPARLFGAEFLKKLPQISFETPYGKRLKKISTLPLTRPMNYDIEYECRWGVPPPASSPRLPLLLGGLLLLRH
jgi:hypothetical protein